MPRSPRRTSIGSPGTRRKAKKVSAISARKIGSVRAMRLAMKRSIWLPGRVGARSMASVAGHGDVDRLPGPLMALSVQPDAVEIVTSEGRDLVVGDLLAGRLEDDGM